MPVKELPPVRFASVYARNADRDVAQVILSADLHTESFNFHGVGQNLADILRDRFERDQLSVPEVRRRPFELLVDCSLAAPESTEGIPERDVFALGEDGPL